MLMFSSNAVFAHPYQDANEEQMDQHAEHENHDGDHNNEDQQVNAQDEECTHQLFWQMQLAPSLIALCTHGSASITCEEAASQTLPLNHTPAQTTTTNPDDERPRDAYHPGGT
jgi:hypothetical protein